MELARNEPFSIAPLCRAGLNIVKRSRAGGPTRAGNRRPRPSLIRKTRRHFTPEILLPPSNFLVSLTSRAAEDLARLRSAVTGVRTMGSRRDLLTEDDIPTEAFLILEGWGMRYKELDDGRRQILAFLLPGDLCVNAPDVPLSHCIGTLTKLAFGAIPLQRLEDLAASPELARTMWRKQMAANAIQLEWLANSGRAAYQATAHLLCELFARAQTAGLAEGNTCEFPPTQFDLACALGLTSVHVNRTLQQLRRDGLIELRARKLVVLDSRGLREAAQFDRGYLHLSAA